MLEFWNDEILIKEQLEAVHSLIASTVNEARSFIRPVLLDHVQAPGKMLRPALVLITSQLADQASTAEVINAAAVVELVHLASLVHDDIIDAAPRRRGRRTLYARLGAKQAVLGGDFLLAKALGLIDSTDAFNARLISSAFARLLESELEQDATVGDFFISKTTYLKRIAGKTASLFALSCYTGAALAKAGPLVEMVSHRIGYALGMAFQIQDDILDYDGSASRLGKETGSDLRCGIPTLPLILALEEERRQGTTMLANLLGRPRLSRRKSALVVRAVDRMGGIAKARQVEERYLARAKADIDRLPSDEVKRLLNGLLATLTARSV